MSRYLSLLLLVPALSHFSAAALRAEGPRLPARASAERSAPGYGPELAVDADESTLWVASLSSGRENNRVWFQLDLGHAQPVARLHWIAAQGSPYPASAPKRYRVSVSPDGTNWKPVAVPPVPDANEPNGDVLLNADARYVRLETEQVNDGTGWSLGLREIWVTGGRDDTAEQPPRPRIVAEDGRLQLTWSLPPTLRPAHLRISRTEAPEARAGKPLAVLPGSARDYLDRVPNWSPRYYHVEAVDARGRVLTDFPLAAGFARPSGRAAEPPETFAFWYESYRPSTGPDPSLPHIGDAAFVVGPSSAEAAQDLARNGKGVLPYVTFYQTSGWAGSFAKEADPQTVIAKIAPLAFYRASVRFPDTPPGFVPSVFCRPGNVEYNPKAIQYTTCPNSAPFREQVLAHVRRQLEGGALGFFVDNGFDDDVAARSVCASPYHKHYYGSDLTAADAFLGLLMEVNCAVKKRHPRGVLMVNGGVPAKAGFYGLTLGDVCDGQLWESYLRSSYSTPKEHVYDWQNVYRRSVDLEKAWHAASPRKMFVLSYPWNREEAFLCYATAKLCHLPWAASLGISDPEHRKFGGHFGTYPELVDLRLGPPARDAEYGGTRLGASYYREYERGMVVVNPTKEAQHVTVPLGKSRRYRDVFAGVGANGAEAALELPPESGRVLLWQ
jgi:F5/8 type C domain